MSQQTPVGLDRLLRPRAIALVGATERSVWSNSAFDNLKRFGYAGRIHLVNRSGGTVYGTTASTSCRECGETIDAAILMVPDAAIGGALEDAAAAGIAGAVILSAGFAEAGQEGLHRQDGIRELARAAGIRLIGPNCLGFVNYVDSTPIWTIAARRQPPGGRLAIVSQSGATAGQISVFAHQQRIGLTYMVSTGNEADVEVAEVIDYLVDEPNTRAIALFLESVRDPRRFVSAVRRAREAGKVVVALKVGSSPISAEAAQSHTGALVGDDRVFDAVCRDLGIIRVNSVEDLVVTAELAGRVGGAVRGRGLGVLAFSGGMCEIAADQAHLEGIHFPPLSTQTVNALQAVLPAGAQARNPLDITGAAMLSPAVLAPVLQAMRADSSLGIVACLFDAPTGPESVPWTSAVIGHIADGFSTPGADGVLLSHTIGSVTKEGSSTTDLHRIVYSGSGLHHGIRALGLI